jgi:hypothetical protein
LRWYPAYLPVPSPMRKRGRELSDDPLLDDRFLTTVP